MAGDWRERYLKLADEAERAQKAHAEADREFTRLITRLCVASSGLDPILDPHLEQLRSAARGGKSARLLQQAGKIGDALVRAADERSQPSVLPLLLGRGALGRRERAEATGLWATIAADPAVATDDQLDRLSELLRSGVAISSEPVAKAGLLARLIGRVPDGTDNQSNRQLHDVLQAVAWPESLQAEVDGFATALENDDKGDAWVGIVRQISDLTVRALDQAQNNARSTESFLTQLNRQLEELDQYMLDEVDLREQSRQSGERLGREMRSEVGTLSASVRDSVDLGQLQASVLGSLDRMHAHVRTHLDEENRRREKAEAETVRLRGELRQVEQDTFDLRRQVAQTQQEAMRDPLTGLPNRRAYDEQLAREYARWKRFGGPLALLVWDVDDFKKINDGFGHKAGDNALVMIGKILRERLRETDFIARFGGEELVVLLTGASIEDALRLADEMRLAVANGGLHAHGKPVDMTISGGLAAFATGDTPESVFERADQAMYRAKQAGKNQVVLGDPQPAEKSP